MKLAELTSGKIYECKLTGKKVLVIEQDKLIEVAPKKKGDEPTTKTIQVKLGKWVNMVDDGTLTYFYQELFDGQLEQLN